MPCPCSSARSRRRGSRFVEAADPMSSFPWLTVIGAIPLAGALVISVTPGSSAPGAEADRQARQLRVKWLALVFSVVALAMTIAMMVAFKTGGPDFQFTQTYQWIDRKST